MVMSIRFAIGLIPALLLLVQDAAAQQAGCALEVVLKDDDSFTPPSYDDVARYIPQNDFNTRYDCLHLGSSYSGNYYYRKLILTQLGLTDRLIITAVKMNSDLGNKMYQKLGASYNDENPVLVLQAGGTKLEADEIDDSNGMNQLFNRADNNGISFFMVIHGVDFVKTGGSAGATTRLRGFSVDLRLAADGNEWVATGGPASVSDIDIKKSTSGAKKILATYWDDDGGMTSVKKFDLVQDTFVCNGFDQGSNFQNKVDTCACIMAFSENSAENDGGRSRTVRVPTKAGCHTFMVKATGNIASYGGLPVESNDINVNCMAISSNKMSKVNAKINACGGADAYPSY